MRLIRSHVIVLVAVLVALVAAPALPQEGAETPRGFLGIGLEQVSDAVRSALALEEGAGVMVGRIVEGGAAEEAGLLAGDVILTLDERPVRGPRELMQTVAGHAPGDSLRLGIWRQGRMHALQAFLGERPADGRAGGDAADGRTVAGNPLGLTPLPLTDQLASYFVAPGGILVARVAEGSPADIAGLLAGDVLVAVDDQEIRNPGELAGLVARSAGPTLLLAVVRNGSDIYIEVALPAAG